MMDRITFSLPAPQRAWLHREAKRLGLTIGELLRRLIDAAKEGK